MPRFRPSDRVADVAVARGAQTRGPDVSFFFFRAVRLAGIMCAVLGLAAVAHAQSAVDGFDPGANSFVYSVAVQADGKILVGGNFSTLGGGGTGTTLRNYFGRLNSDGSLDTSFNPGANGQVRTVAVQADGKILVGGFFSMLGGGGTGTTSRKYLGRLNADGSVDTSFNPGANGGVYAVAVQADGKILVAGVFTGLGGGTGTTTRNHLGRLNADGSLDMTFNPGANDWVFAVAEQADGKVLVSGGFTTLGGGGTGSTTRNYLGRLNADGSLDTSFNPGANEWVMAVAVQADGKILVGGYFTTLGGGGTGATTRNHLGRLNADGSLDATFNPGVSGPHVAAVVVQPDGKILVSLVYSIGRLDADGSLDPSFNPVANSIVRNVVVQADGKILVGGDFTTLSGGGTGATTRNYLGRLNADGSLEVDFNPGANERVNAVAVQADGKILVGGTFTTLGGGTGTTTRNHIGRLNADGSLDTTFNPGANSDVYAVAVQPDGKILVGGLFTGLGGGTGTTPRNFLGRLNTDGSLDTTFNPGASGTVFVIAVQPDGKILVGGSFITLGGGGDGTTTRNHIGRLNADGSLDTTFNPGANGSVYALAVQPDGRILVGGLFSTLGGGGDGTTTRNHIGRLNADGSLDTTFNPGANGAVYALTVQADGKILVGGFFSTLGGGGTGTTTRNHLGRLDADGSLDMIFNPGADDNVFAVAVQADGKILVGGFFTMLGGGGTGTTSRNFLGRLNGDGSPDPSFNPGANGFVLALTVQADGKILVGGGFVTLGGGTGTTIRFSVGRITNTDAAIQSLSVTGSGGGNIVTWSRSGAAPEVWHVTFESSTNGVTYTPLGSGTRVTGGWQLSGVSLPTNRNLFVRARGYYGTGYLNGSGSVVQSIRNGYVPSLVTTIRPRTGPIGGGTVVAITGTNFMAGATVTIGGIAATSVTVVNATRITATTGAHVAGTVHVAVTNPGSGTGTLLNGFTYGTTPPGSVAGDFDGDRAADLALFRPSNGDWMFRSLDLELRVGYELAVRPEHRQARARRL